MRQSDQFDVLYGVSAPESGTFQYLVAVTIGKYVNERGILPLASLFSDDITDLP